LEDEKIMAKVSKRIAEAQKLFDKDVAYDIKEAIDLVKKTSTVKFDATVDAAIRLGVDPRKADQNIRGAMVLPHGTGKDRTVLVFAKGDKAKEALDAGANYAGDVEYIEKITGGWLDFDVVVATPDMMAEVGKLGRVLGPRGLMPNPRTGTVTMDIKKAVDEIKAGKVEYRVDRDGNIHVPVGKVSFDHIKLEENLKAIYDVLLKAKPAAAKGTYVKNVAISSTMGPGIKVDGSTLEK